MNPYFFAPQYYPFTMQMAPMIMLPTMFPYINPGQIQQPQQPINQPGLELYLQFCIAQQSQQGLKKSTLDAMAKGENEDQFNQVRDGQETNPKNISQLSKNSDTVEVNANVQDLKFVEEENPVEQIQAKQARRGKIWGREEKAKLAYLYEFYEGRWVEIVKHFKGRNISQCCQKLRKISPKQNKKMRWSEEEDRIVLDEMKNYGRCWVELAKKLPGRTSKQVRDRYINKLDPKLSKTKWSLEEDEQIAKLYTEMGPKWTVMAKLFEDRSENQVKNRFYYHVQAKYLGKTHDYLKQIE